MLFLQDDSWGIPISDERYSRRQDVVTALETGPRLMIIHE
jgi:hypothetical protein